MHDSTLDLFTGVHRMPPTLEELAAQYEVTVDYLMMEFLIDDESENEKTE
jgi:hypothetical protein|tara:strand:+ start:254 stop:403 length:150 start_codon:yes stop_codon:yes gene_type:complete